MTSFHLFKFWNFHRKTSNKRRIVQWQTRIMSMPRAVANRNSWFPPATFQLRLRSLKTILYVGKKLTHLGSWWMYLQKVAILAWICNLYKYSNNHLSYTLYILASNANRGGHDSGFFFITLHENNESPSSWTSPMVKWSSDKDERLEWSDIEISKDRIHLGLKSIVVKVWFAKGQEQEDCFLETTWGIYFSGLRCLGTHPPSHGRLSPNTLIFYINGSYFTSVDKESADNFIPRYLYIGAPEDCQVIKSFRCRN